MALNKDWKDNYLYKFREKIIYWLNMESFSEAYGWTPEQVENLDAETKKAYSAILTGKGNKSKQ